MLTPRGGIWVREVLVHWGMAKVTVSACVVGKSGSGKLGVDACTCACSGMGIALNGDVCGSTLSCGYVVNGSIAKAAFY